MASARRITASRNDARTGAKFASDRSAAAIPVEYRAAEAPTMTEPGMQQMEHNIARCRVLLSLAAFLVVYIDPEEPLLSRWIQMDFGAFRMDTRLFVIMAAHFTYSLMVYVGLGRWISL